MKLDLNTAQLPVLELTLRDDDRTVVKVSTPTVQLAENLKGLAPKIDALQGLGEGGLGSDAEIIYELAAQLISCNKSGFTCTAAELRDRYRMNHETLILFFNAYTDYMQAVTHGKN